MMDWDQFNGLGSIWWTGINMMNWDQYDGMGSIHMMDWDQFDVLGSIWWTGIKSMDWDQFNGLGSIWWTGINLMDCDQYDGLGSIWWTVINYGLGSIWLTGINFLNCDQFKCGLGSILWTAINLNADWDQYDGLGSIYNNEFVSNSLDLNLKNGKYLYRIYFSKCQICPSHMLFFTDCWLFLYPASACRNLIYLKSFLSIYRGPLALVQKPGFDLSRGHRNPTYNMLLPLNISSKYHWRKYEKVEDGMQCHTSRISKSLLPLVMHIICFIFKKMFNYVFKHVSSCETWMVTKEAW